jgi:beta-glucanase (GH16 family)
LKNIYAGSAKTFLIAALGLIAFAGSVSAQNPGTDQTFEQVVSGMQPFRWYDFRPGGNTSDLNALANSFDPYGIAGTTPTHQEWERYQPFNSDNFRFTPTGLDLTATLPWWGGVWEGGIASGQIWSKESFKPNVTGYGTYAFLARMKIPKVPGSWPQFWLYTKQQDQADGSEIDNPEFMVSQFQNSYNWTGYDHGPGAGNAIYDGRGNPWVWTPGIDFSADYHDYELVWTPNATYKYVDGKLIYAQQFQWTAYGPAQFGAALAVGSWELPGLIPFNWGDFPSALSIQYIGMWAR